MQALAELQTNAGSEDWYTELHSFYTTHQGNNVILSYLNL